VSGAPVIEAMDVGVAYRTAHHPAGTFKEHAMRLTLRQVEYERKWALRGVSFSVAPSEILGVVGGNGAGKSTLMKTLARVVAPTEGRVVVRGRVAPLIELGAGFNAELTGRENIVLYGALLGSSPAAMRRLAEPIAEWAGLEDELDVPIRAYSSGMTARLAFATATAIVPRVLLVDEVLAVGDEAFRQRSWDRIHEMMDAGTAVVLVSHELSLIEALCPETLWIDGGRMRLHGATTEVIAAYQQAAHESLAAS
jgi:ABC-2 type transport system ATP-binding protein/lipopolysaccharide transport system ATP-binding protein